MWNPQSQNGYAYVHNNPLRYVDPSGHWIDGVDDSIWRLLNEKQRSDIIDNGIYFEQARAKNDVESMQYFHDKSNLIRLQFMDSVTRTDYINGGTATIFNTSSGHVKIPKTSANGNPFKPYFKLEGSGAIFLALGAELKVQDGKLTIKVKGGFDGTVGGCLCVGTGADLVSGELDSKGNIKSNFGPTFAKGKYGAVLFYDGGAKLDPSTGAVEWTNGVAAGLGAEANILPFVVGVEGEHTILELQHNPNEFKPVNAAQWNRYFNGESWNSIFGN